MRRIETSQDRNSNSGLEYRINLVRRWIEEANDNQYLIQPRQLGRWLWKLKHGFIPTDSDDILPDSLASDQIIREEEKRVQVRAIIILPYKARFVLAIIEAIPNQTKNVEIARNLINLIMDFEASPESINYLTQVLQFLEYLSNKWTPTLKPNTNEFGCLLFEGKYADYFHNKLQKDFEIIMSGPPISTEDKEVLTKIHEFFQQLFESNRSSTS